MPLPNLDGMWAHPVMKLGEEFCVHDRRPACDVVRACHEVVEVCGLPGLSGVRINGSPQRLQGVACCWQNTFCCILVLPYLVVGPQHCFGMFC